MTTACERVRGEAARPRLARVRARDRRLGLQGVLAALVECLRQGKDANVLRGHLERGVCRALDARQVHLREEVEHYEVPAVPLVEEGTVLSVEVPRQRSRPRAVLSADLGRVVGLDDWGMQFLEMAGNLASLVLELADGRRPSKLSGLHARPPASLVGSSPAMRRLREAIARVAENDFTVLIEGESGTGKELVARQVHDSSRRRNGPFVAVNCAAIVDSLLEAELFGIEDRTATGVRGRRGKFEHADGGTLFLDEVSDLAPAAQAKLLRAIQELCVERVGGHSSRPVDVRIVVATNRSLRELTKRGEFREDLFYRLSGVELQVPPLRERRDDIMELALYFLTRHGRRISGFDHLAGEALRAHEWPGNVRELERLIEGAVTLAQGDQITFADLPPSIRGDYAAILLPSRRRNDTMRAWGARYARLVLDDCGGNKRQACAILGISYHTLQGYLEYRDDRGDGDEEAQPTPLSQDEVPQAESQAAGSRVPA